MFSNNLLMAAAGGEVELVEVANSALFDDDNSEWLGWTPSVIGDNTKIGTVRMWVYKADTGRGVLLSAWHDGGSYSYLEFSASDQLEFRQSNYGHVYRLVTSAVYRDIGWYDIQANWDTTVASPGADDIYITVNGSKVTALGTAMYPAQNQETYWGTQIIHGVAAVNAANYAGCYIAECSYHDGVSIAATSFGEFSADGLYWTPKSSDAIKALTFGTNGFYLDNATNAETDASGNGNNFTNNNTVTTSTHTPTNTFCLFNPLDIGSANGGGAVSVDEGNKVFNGNVDYYSNARCTLPIPTSGLWYWEMVQLHTQGQFGIAGATWNVSANAPPSNDATGYVYGANGEKYNNGSGSAYGDTFTTNDVMGVAYNANTGTIWFSKNDTWQNSATIAEIAAGTTTNAAFTGISGQFFPIVMGNSDGDQWRCRFDSSEYTGTIPTDFLELNTTNTTEASTRTVSDPYEHWANCLYDGTGAALDITIANETPNGSSFDPEFVWTKNRDQTDEHKLVDIVRGATKELNSDSTNAESTDANGVTSITSTDKYVLGTGAGGYNDSGEAFVGWAAKLGGAAAPNTDGSLTSSISANNTLGMVVGTYSGDGSNYTVGHGGNGNSETPLMVIVKNLSTAGQEWRTYHKDLTANYSLNLDDTSAQANTSVITSVGSSTFTVGSGNSSGASGEDYVFIAWFASEFISIGSYEGNDIADGVFISCINSAGVPLQPIWTLHKKSSGAGKDWRILDAGRNEYNALDAQLAPNLSNAEGTADAADFVSGGIKLRSTSGDFNDSSSTYIRLTIGIPEIDRAGRLLTAR